MSNTEEMKEMIQKEIQSIKSLEERVAFKELMEGVFLTLIETNEQMYKKLEARVMDELAYDINRYQIRTGLVERDYLDPSHHLMTAVCEEDLIRPEYKAAQIRECIKKDGKVRLTTVFIQCDAMELKNVYEHQDSYTGVLRTKNEYSVPIRLEPGRRYLDQIERLYHLFMKNGIPWKTVNAPYLFKMADILIRDIPDSIPDEDSITGFDTDFGEYGRYIHYNMIPLWNIRRLQLNSVGFPIPCGDYENYEHTISLREYGEEHAYLVEEKQGIRNIRQSGNKLMITGQIANAKKWDVYMIRNGSGHKIDRYRYPLMENLRKDGFAERFWRRSGQTVKTKGELERFIRGLGLENYIEYQDCALTDQIFKNQETYSMNFFMKDEIRDKGGRKQLTMYFKPKGSEIWLLRDLMSFIASEVQELYPEYQCGGKMV